MSAPSLNKMIRRWLAKTKLFHSPRANAARFIAQMQADGYEISDTVELSEHHNLEKKATHNMGLRKGVRMAAAAFLNPDASRQEVAALLYSAHAYEALNDYRKSKKLGWKALGFTNQETAIIKHELDKSQGDGK